MAWKDSTGYSRDEPYETRKPRSWSIRLTPDFTISVVSEHIYHKGQWVMHCAPWFDTHDMHMPVANHTAEEAQAKALEMVREKIAELNRAVSALTT